MKKTLFFLILCLPALLQTFIFAETASLAGQFIDGKYYVAPGTVHVGPENIYLNLEGNLYPIQAVCIDDYGVYVLGYEVRRETLCTRCGRVYDSERYSDRCPHTGQKCNTHSN